MRWVARSWMVFTMALPFVARAQSTPPVASEQTLPSVTLPPALERVLRDYEVAWRARDAAGLAKLFTEDGFVLSGGRPPVRGRAAVEARYTGAGGPLHLRAVAFAVDDTVGYIIGTYGGTPETINDGKFTLTLRRAPGGRWLIASDMDNPNQPMGPRRPPNTTPDAPASSAHAVDSDGTRLEARAPPV